MTTLTKDIRNIALVGHSGTGKTLLADAFLLNDGKINRLGSVREGTTTSDHTADEIERQMSLRASLMHVHHHGVKLNLLDAPGYIDFSGELRAVVHVADAAVMTVDATSGIEIGTEMAWEALEERNIPPFIAVTMLDKEHSDFDAVLSALQERWGDRVFPAQFPVNEGPALKSLVDVLKKKLLVFDDKGNYKEEAIPSEHQARVDELYEKLVELVAESDDSLLEKYFDEGELSSEEINNGLKNAVSSRTLFPLVCVSSEKNVGISRLGDILSELAPSPEMAGEAKGFRPGHEEETITRSVDASEPASIFVAAKASMSSIWRNILL